MPAFTMPFLSFSVILKRNVFGFLLPILLTLELLRKSLFCLFSDFFFCLTVLSVSQPYLKSYSIFSILLTLLNSPCLMSAYCNCLSLTGFVDEPPLPPLRCIPVSPCHISPPILSSVGVQTSVTSAPTP